MEAGHAADEMGDDRFDNPEEMDVLAVPPEKDPQRIPPEF